MFPFSLVFLAGGVGSRMNQPIPKQYIPICGKPLALFSFETFLSMTEIQDIVVVCDVNYETLFRHSADQKGVNIQFAKPGIRRQDSVYNGIQCLKNENALVCIHDSARPLIEMNTIRKIILAANEIHAAVVGVKLKSTIKISDQNQFVINTPDRRTLWEVQTPQVIRLNLLKEAFLHVNQFELTVTDDVSLVELLKKPVKIVEGEYTNIKVTTIEDLTFVEEWIKKHALLQTHNSL